MKRALILAAAVGCLTASAVEIDGVAARVGTDVILKSDVLIEMRRSHADKERFNEIRNEMIERKLIVKAAAAAKMTMQEWVVENRVREIIQKAFDGDRNKLISALAHDKVSYPEWYAKIKEDMVVSAMRYQVVDKNVTASPSELRREFQEHPERYEEGVKVTVSSILLKPEDASRKGEILDALKDKSQTFAELAKRFSSDAQAANGGEWKDIVPKDAFRAEICDAIDRLKPGETGPWVELDGWSYLLRKDAESGGRKMTFEEAYDRIVENVKEAEAKRLYTAWIERLKAETYVKVF